MRSSSSKFRFPDELEILSVVCTRFSNSVKSRCRVLSCWNLGRDASRTAPVSISSRRLFHWYVRHSHDNCILILAMQNASAATDLCVCGHQWWNHEIQTPDDFSHGKGGISSNFCGGFYPVCSMRSLVLRSG